MHDIDALNVLFGDAVTVTDGKVTVARPEALASPTMDELVRTAVFGEPLAREYARWLIWELGQAAGVRSLPNRVSHMSGPCPMPQANKSRPSGL